MEKGWTGFDSLREEVYSKTKPTAMGSVRTKAQPVGSAGWIQNEREQAKEFVDQEVEELSFSVRNELEWLNEHMAEIFSKNPTYVFSSNAQRFY